MSLRHRRLGLAEGLAATESPADFGGGLSRRLREGDRFMDGRLVLGAESCPPRLPGSPDSAAEIPVPAAHQAGRVDRLVAADDWAALWAG